MTKSFSLISLLGKGRQNPRLPDLGDRELDVLDVLWRHGSQTSTEVLQRVGAAGLSLSTVQSTLERLHRKHLLRREKHGRAFVYTALLSKQNLISRLMHDIADSLTDGDTAPMVSGFLDYLGDDEAGGAADTTLRGLLDQRRSSSE